MAGRFFSPAELTSNCRRRAKRSFSSSDKYKVSFISRISLIISLRSRIIRLHRAEKLSSLSDDLLHELKFAPTWGTPHYIHRFDSYCAFYEFEEAREQNIGCGVLRHFALPGPPELSLGATFSCSHAICAESKMVLLQYRQK